MQSWVTVLSWGKDDERYHLSIAVCGNMQKYQEVIPTNIATVFLTYIHVYIQVHVYTYVCIYRHNTIISRFLSYHIVLYNIIWHCLHPMIIVPCFVFLYCLNTSPIV